MKFIARRLADCPVFRIQPTDSNKFVLLVEPATHGARFCSVLEIFDVAGATPSNTHAAADEHFYVIAGQGVAMCGGVELALAPGDSFLVSAGVEHVVRNTGSTRLYCLTTMVPDENFAALIRAGVPDRLDAEDRAALGVA